MFRAVSIVEDLIMTYIRFVPCFFILSVRFVSYLDKLICFVTSFVIAVLLLQVFLLVQIFFLIGAYTF